MDEKELEALKASNPKAYDSYMALKAEHDKLKTAPPPKKDDPNPDPDPDKDKSLEEKARQEREKKEQDAKNTAKLESSLAFTMKLNEWAKTNERLLPKSIPGLIEQAEKEKYDNSIQKASAIQSAIISEFFAVQANLDLLTENQKSVLADYLNLTKNAKQERASDIYNTIFEPTFEGLIRVEKAKQVAKGGGANDSTDSEQKYKNKLMEGSKKHYLRESKNA